MTESTTTSAAPTGDGGPAPVTTLGDAAAALALADSSSATPDVSSTPAETTPVAATAPPEGTDTPESGPTEAKGEPPKWRWQDILENTRTTVAKETEERIRKEVETQYAGLDAFKGLNADQRAGLVVWQRAIDGDPAARARVAQAAQSNPQLAQALKGLIASETPAPTDAEPEPDLQAADGTLVYSAKQQAAREQWLTKQITTALRSEFQKELQPFQSVAQTFQQEKASAAYTSSVASVIAAMTAADPVFAEHKADVSKVLQDDPRLLALALGDGQRPPDPATALEVAWNRVYRSKVLPAKQSQTEAQVVASLQQRAVAGTTNPATATSATPKSTLGDARAALEHATASLGG